MLYPFTEEWIDFNGVNWKIEESFQLRSMRVQHHYTRSSSLLHQICHQLGRDGHSSAIFLVSFAINGQEKRRSPLNFITKKSLCSGVIFKDCKIYPFLFNLDLL